MRALSTVLVAGVLSASALAAAAEAQPRLRAVVRAEVVALDHLVVYNRFGSFDPFGMIFALRRDISDARRDGAPPTAAVCGAKLGTEAGEGDLEAGQVRLKDCKRPRPLVLRANAGDVLEVTVTNLLQPQPGFSETFCREPAAADPAHPVRRDIRAAADGQCRRREGGEPEAGAGTDWPATRHISFTIPGLEPLPLPGQHAVDRRCLGTDAAVPSETFTCRWRLDREGTHLFSSLAAPAGGEGDGGSLTHGLYGALIVEPEGSSAYRSQVPKAAFDAAWSLRADVSHARTGPLRYEALTPADLQPQAADTRPRAGTGAPTPDCVADGAVPILNMLRPCGSTTVEATTRPVFEIVHGDLNAVVVPPAAATPVPSAEAQPFREFTVIFHDELKTFYTDKFTDLERFGQLSGVRDGFGINYGASGAGAMIIANRNGIGPAADCVECLYEEFFLQSWANGDPALLEGYADDPSNVHHSYLNDKVVFRNFHAGPKETHVFHLHSHQWLAGNDENRGAYLDSQTIAPQQGFTYRIYHGGLKRYAPDGAGDEAGEGARGWWGSLGSGNRNRTPGDAIFHCHLYPHFAQGMWALWRVHDVLEDGSRLLPDGQDEARLSLATRASNRGRRRAGTVAEDGSLFQGTRTGPGSTELVEGGTPVPGIIPLPEQAAPLLPTYGPDGMPGYPFYLAGKPGHRAPQPPLDIARAVGNENEHHDAGLPRHVVTGGSRQDAAPSIAAALAIGDMTAEITALDLDLLPYDGTKLERRAMAFHHDGRSESAAPLDLRDATGNPVRPGQNAPDGAPFVAAGGYRAPVIARDGTTASTGRFLVNGAPAAPGAPFADPCGAQSDLAGQISSRFPDGRPGPRTLPSIVDRFRDGHPGAPPDSVGGAGWWFTPDPGLTGVRRFEVSAVQLDMVVNRAGWHDPQARINVLTESSADWKAKKRGDAEPFYFRAFSGECIEFRHTNELPKDLELDDFQLKVPTDTIGQHIHLVKFDVTSADGSGNGFNYEDGTFAPDEVLARICHAQGRTRVHPDAPVGAPVPALRLLGRSCDAKEIWRVSATGAQRAWFQTTVQRWFADPLLSDNGAATEPKLSDRTLRTVFTHDHFSASNIQQHGFYSALLIEPQHKAFCVHPSPEAGSDPHGCETKTIAQAQGEPIDQRPPAGPGDEPVRFARGDRRSVGARASVTSEARNDPLHPDYREYALAIADFALLYDGRPDKTLPLDEVSEPKGLARLVGEAEGRIAFADPEDETGARPGTGEQAPAEVALPTSAQAAALRAHAEEWRGRHGRPVAPPPRPEAVSQKHHDPYLVNYRDEPIPLRVGGPNEGAPAVGPDRRCGEAASAQRAADSVKVQRGGDPGDLANTFRSAVHGDPCTPVLDAVQGDRVVLRVVHGAHEVQHMLTVEGRPFPRNHDQRFPSSYLSPSFDVPNVRNDKGPRGYARRCLEASLDGRPLDYFGWLLRGVPGTASGPFFTRLANSFAGCDNVEGYVTAQEIGLSEHFEISALYRADFTGILRRAEQPRPHAERAPADSERSTATDYLYHFGTIDALWNGAWGLLRVHENLDAPDLTACLAERRSLEACRATAGARIGVRLPPLGRGLQAFGGPAGPAGPAAAAPDRSVSPTAACPPGAPQVAAAIAAVEARAVLRRPGGLVGLVYDEAAGLSDPDGLLLVMVDPGKLGLSDPDELFSASSDPTRRPRIPAGVIQAAARAALGGRQQPLVLRVNAGDCLRLAVLNGLPGDLPDRSGDALMPPIVPLNVDRRRPGMGEVRPSAKLALSIPLSAVSPARDTPLPFGVNPGEAVSPEAAQDGANWYGLEFYAGRLWTDADRIDQALASNALSIKLGDGSAASIRLMSGPQGRTCDMAAPVYEPVVVVGRRYCVAPAGAADPALAGKLAAELANPSERSALVGEITTAIAREKEITRHIRQIPYAFGALPIKSLGDMIGHGVHGLAGTLVVEPQGARYVGRAGDPAVGTILVLRGPMPERDRIDAPDALGEDERRARRLTFAEHMLLWQDGLNLRDATKASADPASGGAVPDCRICDDSYDLGEKGVSYRSAGFIHRLRGVSGVPWGLGARTQDGKDGGSEIDLNAYVFPRRFLSPAFRAIPTPTLRVGPGEELLLRLTHPQGRARQRAFVALGTGYDDIFPGFGSGHSGLLAPGKGLTAGLCAPRTAGDYPWFDGPRHIFAGGTWGVMAVGGRPERAALCEPAR